MNLRGKSITSALAYASLLVSVALVTAPLLLPGFLAGHDRGVHQTYTFLFDRALGQGQLPVRWVEGLVDGRGQPLFNTYQVGFYYLIALLHRLGLSLSLSLKVMTAAPWVLGALFMWLWCRPFGKWPAAAAAAVFVWSPYLMVDAYIRTDYPEMAAIAFAAGVFWAIERTLRTERISAVWTLALLTTLLLITHPPTALVVAPVAAAYVAGRWLVDRYTPKAISLAMIGAVLGGGLAAFYLGPAMLELGMIKASRLGSGYFDYHLHFVDPRWWFDWSWTYGASGPNVTNRMPMQIGIVQWMVVVASIAWLIRARTRQPRSGTVAAIIGGLVVVAAALFMMTEPSTAVWDRIGPLRYVQFPWRLLLLPTIACGVLAAALLSVVPRESTQALAVVGIVVLSVAVTWDYRAQAMRHERIAPAIDRPGWPFGPDVRRWGFREPSFDPVSVGDDAHEAVGRWSVIDGAADVTPVATISDTSIELLVTAQNPATVAINSPFAPGWQVLLDGERVTPKLESSSGFMRVIVPAGAHHLDAAFVNTPIRTTANAVTLFSFLPWLTLVCSPLLGRVRRYGRARLKAIRDRSAEAG